MPNAKDNRARASPEEATTKPAARAPVDPLVSRRSVGELSPIELFVGDH